MILLDTYAVVNLFIACSFYSFFIELTFRLIKDKSLLAAFISAFLFSPLYGISLTLFLSIKPDSLLIESIMLVSIMLLLETIKQLIRFYLIQNLSVMNRSHLFWSMMIWALSFACYSEWVYPKLEETIRILPYSCLIIFTYCLLYIGGVYFIQRLFKELNQKIEELQSIHLAQIQVQTAQNEIIQGIRELNIDQDEYLEAVHEKCMHDMTDLDLQYEEAFLKLSPLQQKLIKACPVLVPVQNRVISAQRKNQSV